MARYIVPEQDDTNVALGRLIKEESYSREKKEIRVENMVIDVIKREKEELVVCEVKKSSKYLQSAKMQLLYYLYQLKQKGLIVKGELLFPKEKEKISVELTGKSEIEIKNAINKIQELVNKENPPILKKNTFCKRCAYRELCYA